MNTQHVANYDLFDQFSKANSALAAFDYLITTAIEKGDDFAFVAVGVSDLLKSQRDVLEHVEAEMRARFFRIGAGTYHARDTLEPASPGADFYERTMDLIANLMARDMTLSEIETVTRLSTGEVLKFIEAMPEAVKLQAVEAATVGKDQPDPKNLRAKFISDKISEGYDAGDIANALNLKKATVEKVIRQLMAAPADDGHGPSGHQRENVA